MSKLADWRQRQRWPPVPRSVVPDCCGWGGKVGKVLRRGQKEITQSITRFLQKSHGRDQYKVSDHTCFVPSIKTRKVFHLGPLLTLFFQKPIEVPLEALVYIYICNFLIYIYTHFFEINKTQLQVKLSAPTSLFGIYF